MEKIYGQDLPKEQQHVRNFCTVDLTKASQAGSFNPISEIGKLDYELAKKYMMDLYAFKLTEKDYPLLLLASSPLDFFMKASQNRDEMKVSK